MSDRSTGEKDLAWLFATLRARTKPLTRKRTKKLAGQLSEAAIRASLGMAEGQEIAAYILEGRQTDWLHNDGSDWLHFWDDRGRTIQMFDDTPPALRFAQIQYLRARGYPVFRSQVEADAYAARCPGPGKVQDPASS